MEEVVIKVYSEYEYILRAFKFVSMMFAPGSGYYGLIATLAVAGIAFGAFYFVSQSANGKGNIIGFAVSMMFAAVITITLTTMQTQVVVHDVVNNKFETAGNVPTIMAKLAQLQNVIEQDTVEIIETLMQPIIPYGTIGKGKGYELLASYDDVAESFFQRQPYTFESMSNYWNSCVIPDLTYGWIDEQKLHSSTDLWKDIKTETMTRYATVVSNAGGVRTTQSQPCATAYATIDAQLNTSAINDSLKVKCEASGISTDNCSSIMSNIFSANIVPASNSNVFLRSYLTAWVAMSEGGMLNTMLADMNQKNASQAFMAEATLPRLKGMMFGMMIGIFPFLIAFMWIAPARTISYYVGMFVMMVLWQAIDTFMDMQYQHEVHNMFAIMRETGYGLNQMFDIPNTAADAVSLYGQGRWMSMGLAVAIAGAITKANAFAMSQMGNQLAMGAKGAANAGAEHIGTAGQGKLMNEAGQDFGHANIANMPGVANQASYVHGTGNALSQTNQSKAYSANQQGEAIGNNTAVSQVTGGTSAGGVIGGNTMANSLGMNTQEYAEFQKTGNIITQDMANEFAKDGMSQTLANQMVGLKMNSVGLDSNGDITNVTASGIRDGKNWSIDTSNNTATSQDGAVTSTFKYDENGQFAAVSKEGGGFYRFSQDAQGNTYGSHTYSANGVEYTDKYNGTDMSRSYLDENNNKITENYVGSELKNSETVLGKDAQLGGITMEAGGKFLSTGEQSTYQGQLSTADGRTFEGNVAFNDKGEIVNMTATSGQQLMQKDIDDFNHSRMETSKVGSDIQQLDINDTTYSRMDTSTTGNKEDVYINDKNIHSGTDVKGYQGGRGIVEAGAATVNMTDKMDREAFVDNYAKYLNSINKQEGNEQLSEKQALSVAGQVQASAGLEVLGNGATASVTGRISAELDHSSGNMSSVDLNRILISQAVDSLEQRRSDGEFNTTDKDGNVVLDVAKYNEAYRDTFETLENATKEAYSEVYGPGNLTNDVLNKVSDVAGDVGGEIGEGIQNQLNEVGERAKEQDFRHKPNK